MIAKRRFAMMTVVALGVAAAAPAATNMLANPGFENGAGGGSLAGWGAFANAFPELCHNEILGWVRANDQGVKEWVGVMLQDGTETQKMKKRAEVTAQLVSDRAIFHNVHARGETLLEKLLSLALFGDFVSLYLAALNAVDPVNIDSINVLKKELANVP